MIVQLKKGNKFYLLKKYLKKKSKILNFVKFELFFIKIKKKMFSYKLKLANNAIIYIIFYISLLEVVNLKTFIENKFYY